MAKSASTPKPTKGELIKRERERLQREADEKVRQATDLLKPILKAALDRVSLLNPNAAGTHFEVQLNPDYEITFEMLEAISKAFDTKLINLHHETGWGGSDVTGAEPDKMWISISPSRSRSR